MGHDAEEARRSAEVKRGMAEKERLSAYQSWKATQAKKAEITTKKAAILSKQDRLLSIQLQQEEKKLQLLNSQLISQKVEELGRLEWAAKKLSPESLAELETFKNSL